MYQAFCLGGFITDCILTVFFLSQGEFVSAGIFACCAYLFSLGFTGGKDASR